MTSEGDTTLLKNKEKLQEEIKKPLRVSQVLGSFACRSVLVLKQGRHTDARAGAGLRRSPGAGMCFVSGSSTDSRKPHVPTALSFRSLRSSVRLVKKACVRDVLYQF